MKRERKKKLTRAELARITSGSGSAGAVVVRRIEKPKKPKAGRSK